MAETPGIARAAWIVASKDLTVELRSRSAFLAVLVFAVLGLAVFYFAWDPTAVAAIDLAPGVLYMTFTFAALLGMHRAFGAEQHDRAIDALLTAPIERESIFIGKLVASFVFVGAVLLIAVPAVGLFYNLPFNGSLAMLGLVAVLATVGLVAVGTLFGAMAVNTRLSELLLPMLSLPFFVPVVIASAQASALLVAGRPVATAMPWLRILAAFDLVFIVACTLAYPFTLEE